MTEINWKFVVFPESIPENGTWIVAQCLEHDMAIQVREMKELSEAIAATVIANIIVSKEHGCELTDEENWIKAPQEYWDLFERQQAVSFATKTLVSFEAPEAGGVRGTAELALTG